MANAMHRHSRKFAACLALTLALAAAASPPDITNTIPVHDRDIIEAAIGVSLIIEETALWKFTSTNSFPAGGQLYCGTVTAQDSRREYMAPERFFAVVQDGRVVKTQLDSGPATDPLGDTRFQISLLCDKMK